VSDYVSATAGAYILGLSAWAALGAGYLLGGPLGWLFACLLAAFSVRLALRAFQEGEAMVPALVAPVASAAVLFYLFLPRWIAFPALVVFLGWWLATRLPRTASGTVGVSSSTVAYVLGLCAWGLVGLYFLPIDPSNNTEECGSGFLCLGGLGDEIYWFTVLAPPFFLLSLAGVTVAAGALWRHGWSSLNFGALAVAGSGPAIYAALALRYG
jgi:hypothetical protein